MTATTASITATPTSYRLQVQEFIAGFSALVYQIVTFKMILLAGLGDALSVAASLTAFVAIAGLGAILAKKIKSSTAGWIELLTGGIGVKSQ